MKEKPEDDPSDPNDPGYQFFFTVPWEHQGDKCFDGRQMTPGIVRLLAERTRLHELYIREEAKTARLRLFLACLMFLCGCAVLLCAPERRETASHWIGATMLIASGGVAGYGRLWAKSKVFEIRADQKEGKK